MNSTNKKAHLHERLDNIFNNGSMWQHRTLRTVFDPFSSEWNDTDMDNKISILQKIIHSGENLEKVFEEYKLYYRNESTKPYVADDAYKGLLMITQSLLNKK